MAKSYNGGSTLINRAGFATFDPAEKDSISASRLGSKRPKVKKQPIRYAVNFILDNAFNGRESYRLPKTVDASLRAEIDQCDSKLEWAKKQQCFQELYDRKLAERAKKLKASLNKDASERMREIQNELDRLQIQRAEYQAKLENLDRLIDRKNLQLKAFESSNFE